MEVLVNRKFAIFIAFIALLMIPAMGQAVADSNISENTKVRDLSKPLPLFLAVEGGSGFIPGSQPTAYVGIKIGANDVLPRPWTWTIDMGYDRIRESDGFSIATTGMLPLFRLPGPQRNESKNYLRVCAGPGIGYRTPPGGFGAFLSANIMLALLSDQRINEGRFSPFVGYQRRFPMADLPRGDNRLTFGFLLAF